MVGATGSNDGVSEAGTAYIFDATTGGLTTTLSNPAPATGDRFGSSVAISGNRAVVGARYDDAAANNAGTAYVFDVMTGGLTTTLSNPAPAAGDAFGVSVALSGNIAIVGAHEDDAGGTDVGRAYAFDATTGALVTTLSNPAPIVNEGFGQSVAISGNVAVIGARLDDVAPFGVERAYVFNATTGSLSAMLNNPVPTVIDRFGHSVAVSGAMAVIGAYNVDNVAANAGSAYVFNIAPHVAIPAPQDILSALIDQSAPSPGLETNCDGVLDIADLLRAAAEPPGE